MLIMQALMSLVFPSYYVHKKSINVHFTYSSEQMEYLQDGHQVPHEIF